MFKKLGVAALVMVATLFTLHKLDLLGYVKMYANKAKQSANESIPPEVKIERLKAEIDNLKPEMNKQRTVIAKESTQIDALTDEIVKAKANLKDREEKLAMLRDELKKGNGDLLVIQNETLSRQKVEGVFTRKFEEFQAAEAALKAKQELLDRRKEKLEVALVHLKTMDSKQKELKSKVELMEIELAKLREAQMQNDLAVDDTQFSNVMKLYDEVNMQIATQKKQLELQRAADTDVVVEKALEQKAQTKKAIEQWDERVTTKDAASPKVTKKD